MFTLERFYLQNFTTYMLTVHDELKGAGLVYTMLRKCFGDDFDAKNNCSRIAFTKDYKVRVDARVWVMGRPPYLSSPLERRVRFPERIRRATARILERQCQNPNGTDH